MSRHTEVVLRMACLVLAALLVLQLVAFARRSRPLAGVRVPRLELSVTTATPGRAVSPGQAPTEPATPVLPTNLPSAVQAQIDRIAESEILGPVPKPVLVPVALLGIAGRDVFLRTPTGQTGLLRVGEELGGIKLLQIGTNRVLIEEEGHRKELSMFSGFGGQPLLPQEKENPK